MNRFAPVLLILLAGAGALPACLPNCREADLREADLREADTVPGDVGSPA